MYIEANTRFFPWNKVDGIHGFPYRFPVCNDDVGDLPERYGVQVSLRPPPYVNDLTSWIVQTQCSIRLKVMRNAETFCDLFAMHETHGRKAPSLIDYDPWPFWCPVHKRVWRGKKPTFCKHMQYRGPMVS